MGAQESLLAHEQEGELNFVLPIPKSIFNPLKLWSKTQHHMRHDSTDPDLILSFRNFMAENKSLITSYREFLANPANIVALVQPLSLNDNPFQYVKVMSHIVFNHTRFTDYTLLETELHIDTISSFESSPAYIFLKEQIQKEFAEKQDHVFIVYVLVKETSSSLVGHANMVILNTCFEKKRRDLTVAVIDPHGNNNVNVLLHQRVWQRFADTLNAFEFRANPLRTHVLSPYVEGGLQQSEPVCVQWAVILGLTYVLNIRRQCYLSDNVVDINSIMYHINVQKELIMTAYLYWIHMIVGYIMPVMVSQDFSTLLEPELLLKPLSLPVVRISSRIGSTQQYLETEPSTCVYDIYECGRRSHDDCKSPCKWDTTGCFNGELFEDKRQADGCRETSENVDSDEEAYLPRKRKKTSPSSEEEENETEKRKKTSPESRDEQSESGSESSDNSLFGENSTSDNDKNENYGDYGIYGHNDDNNEELRERQLQMREDRMRDF